MAEQPPWGPPPPPPAPGSTEPPINSWGNQVPWTPPPPPPANGQKIAIIVASVLGGCCLLMVVLMVLAPFILALLGLQTVHSTFQVTTNNQFNNVIYSNAVNAFNVV